MFRRFPLLLLFLMWIQPSTSILKECKGLDMSYNVPNIDKIEACAQKLNSLSEKDKEKHSAVKGKTFLAGMLKEKTAKDILSVRKMMFQKVIIENTNWRSLTIGATEVGKNFFLNIDGNPLLRDVHFNSSALSNKKIKVRGNAQLSQETIERFNGIEGNNTFIQEAGECQFSSPISDFSHLIGCTSITKMVALDSLPAGELRQFPLGKNSCLHIRQSNLTSIAFLDFSKTALSTKCTSKIVTNPLLCLSERQKSELKRIWPTIIIKKNDDKCEYECLASEIMDGTLSGNKTCFVIRGKLVLDKLSDNFIPSIDFSKISEIRGGGLQIKDAKIKNFDLFPNLMAIDLEDSQGPAIELTNTDIITFSLPSLLKIDGNSTEGPLIILKNNVNLEISGNEKAKWEALSGGRLEISNSQKATESVNATTPATGKKDNSKKSEFPWLLFSLAVGAGVVLILCLILLPVFVFVTFRGSFRLPKVKELSTQKKELLKELAGEALKMNPLEWRQMAIDESQMPKKSAEKTNTRMAMRTKYALFLDKILANYPLKFRSPFECKETEIFSSLKKFYQKTNGKGVLILLSKHSDPSVSVSIFSGKRGAEKAISGHTKDEEGSATTITMKDTTMRESTMRDTTMRESTMKEMEQGGKVFEARAKLLKSKKYNDDIMIYTYSIHLTEGDPGKQQNIKYKLKLVNYHTWGSGPVPKDRSTIIQLCEYSRNNKSMFATTSSSHTFSLLMNKMIADHLSCLDYPNITIDDAKVFLTDLVQMSCTPDDALVFCLMTVLDWANREMLISSDKTQKYKDFVHVYEKLIKYMSEHPNNLFFDVKDLQLNDDVSKRVKESSVYKKMSMVSIKEATVEPTISIAGKVEEDSFKKDDSIKLSPK